VTWQTLSRSADNERWEMVVPRMVRPARIAAAPDLFTRLPDSTSVWVLLWRWIRERCRRMV